MSFGVQNFYGVFMTLAWLSTSLYMWLNSSLPPSLPMIDLSHHHLPSWSYLVGRGTSYFSSITKALLSFRQFRGCWYWVCKKLGAKSLRSSSSWWWTGNPGMLQSMGNSRRTACITVNSVHSGARLSVLAQLLNRCLTSTPLCLRFLFYKNGVTAIPIS